MRTARSQSSGEYLLGRAMGFILSRNEPSDKPGTVQSVCLVETGLQGQLPGTDGVLARQPGQHLLPRWSKVQEQATTILTQGAGYLYSLCSRLLTERTPARRPARRPTESAHGRADRSGDPNLERRAFDVGGEGHGHSGSHT